MGDLKVIAKWYSSKCGRYSLDAAKVEKDGEIFWTWVDPNTGEKNPGQSLFTLGDLQTNNPKDDLTKTAMGLFGSPDWTCSGAVTQCVTAKNNDGRDTCYACGAITKSVMGFNSEYQVCTKCGK